MNSRRTFVLGAGSALAVNVAARKVAASDKIRVAVLGVNGRGKDHIKGFQSQPGAEVAMLCDPDRSVADERALEFFDAYQKPVKVVQDLRRVFDNKDIDAVSIARVVIRSIENVLAGTAPAIRARIDTVILRAVAPEPLADRPLGVTFQ